MKKVFVLILMLTVCCTACACHITDSDESTSSTNNKEVTDTDNNDVSEDRLSDHPLVAHITGEWALDSNAELEEAPYTHLLLSDDGSGIIDGVSVAWEIAEKYTSENSIHIAIYEDSHYICSIVYWSKSQLVQVVDEDGDLLECYYHSIAYATV